MAAGSATSAVPARSSPCHQKFVFFFHDAAPTEIYTLSLHDALPILRAEVTVSSDLVHLGDLLENAGPAATEAVRSEEHTSELQSHSDLVCRLLLEKKKRGRAIRH